MIKVAYSPVYKYELPEGHRFPMEKYELIPEQLLYESTLNQDQFFFPSKLTDEEICLTHCPDFLRKLNELELSHKEVRNIGFPVSDALIDRGKYIAGGTYECALFAMEYGVALNVAGGTHHSFKDRGEGFCIFNDFAIASNLLLSRDLVKKILIIDLDVHQGNGTASIFRERSEVFTFSMHGAKNYPLRKEKSDLDINLPDGTEDAEYLNILRSHLPSLIHRVAPDFIFYLSGVDVLKSDKLGRLGMTIQGAKERDRFVFEQCSLNDIPVAVSMGGGYSSKVVDIVEAHSNTFRVAMEIFGE